MSGTNREGKKDAQRRMEARAHLDDPMRPPVYLMAIVDPNWKDGKLLPPIEPDYNVAQWGERKIYRELGETLEEFETRLLSYMPLRPPFPFVWLDHETVLPEKPATAPTEP